jgi:signal transduction histidine kinase
LNAIYNSAEILFESISKFRDASKADTGGRILVPPEQLDEDLEALNTILLCSKHQKSIADDVLRISKLSANLVELNPAPFHPLASTEETLSMFKVETSVKKIALVMASHHSISSRTRCVADGTRFQQVRTDLAPTLCQSQYFCR